MFLLYQRSGIAIFVFGIPYKIPIRFSPLAESKGLFEVNYLVISLFMCSVLFVDFVYELNIVSTPEIVLSNLFSIYFEKCSSIGFITFFFVKILVCKRSKWYNET